MRPWEGGFYTIRRALSGGRKALYARWSFTDTKGGSGLMCFSACSGLPGCGPNKRKLSRTVAKKDLTIFSYVLNGEIGGHMDSKLYYFGFWASITVMTAGAIFNHEHQGLVVRHDHVPEIAYHTENYSLRPIVTRVSSSPGYGTYYSVK
jgi:hypothetical protein